MSLSHSMLSKTFPIHAPMNIFLLCLFLLQFEEVLNEPDTREDIRKLVDPRLGDSYPLDSVRKVRTVLAEVYLPTSYSMI